MVAGSICGQGECGEGMVGGGAVAIGGGGGVVQNRESPDFRSLEVGISEMAEYWPHYFFMFLLT